MLHQYYLIQIHLQCHHILRWLLTKKNYVFLTIPITPIIFKSYEFLDTGAWIVRVALSIYFFNVDSKYGVVHIGVLKWQYPAVN